MGPLNKSLAPGDPVNPEKSSSLYADPMVYDILYTPGTWREIDALERIEREWVRRAEKAPDPDRLWLEPACGSGRYLRVAAGRGRRTAGFDLHTEMLRYCAGRTLGKSAPAPLLFRADMTAFLGAAHIAGLASGQVDFAFNPVNSIRHLKSDREFLLHFEQMAELLKPGALYIVGISLTDYEFLLPEEDSWIARRGGCRVNQLVNYLPPEPGTGRARIEAVLSHLTVERPNRIEHLDSSYNLRCYDKRQWQSLVKKSALEWAGSYNAQGRRFADVPQAYQLEVLIKPPNR
jgi:Methyltransferase domain